MNSINRLNLVKEKLAELLNQEKLVILAIDGYGGSGKSTLSKEIQSEFSNSVIIPFDDFATSTNGAQDRKRFLEQVLIPLKDEKVANYQQFNWIEEKLGNWKAVEPEGVIILEGTSLLGEDFNSYYDLRIWVDCPHEVASKRGMDRDKNEYQVNNDKKWNDIWIKEEQEYAKTEPWNKADILIKVRN